MSVIVTPRDSSLDSVELKQEKLTAKISNIEEKKVTKWTPSRNLGNYILCHVRRVSSKANDEEGENSEDLGELNLKP